jgi:hypothetical protein
MEEQWYYKETESYMDYMIRLWSDAELWSKLNSLKKNNSEEGVAVLWRMKRYWQTISLEELKKDCLSRSSFSRIQIIEQGEIPFFILHRHIARRAWETYHEREI